ncbi:MAG: UvrD-helicase domain-containing protein [Prevotella sp.]|nr:UvrD-helicase domain-containing protein [Prevotella sp.]
MVETPTPLIIYKASAGSGKTFTLATEYIKLLVRNPQSYRQILAVTFTNKATEEMKMRILSQLYGIWRRLPSSDGYAQVVCRELDASPDFVAHQAGQALTLLLHNYSYFRVETIDSFFQSVLRNLARELDLTANLHIGLNDSQVEELAVDQLIENLQTTDVMLQWLLKYIMETIGDDRSWNIIGQVKQFGKTIFRDYYKQKSQELYQQISQPAFFEQYADKLKDMRRTAKERMQEIAESFFAELEGAGFSIDDLSYGRTGVASFFLKLRDGVFDESVVGKRVADCNGQPEKWYKKTHPRREELHVLADTTLGDILRYGIEQQPVQWRLYKSADLTLRHLNQLRLLDSIEKKVRELNEGANRFLLSDTQQLLHELIDGSDSPFIFEKIGTQLEHIMIDEFQDTSTVQWQNFKVLLQETMSHEGTENLIVGDVKQSIYRWRSGDWRLLHNITSEFEHSSELLKVRTLDTNYRSCRRVVAFNNAFFTKAAELEGVSAYDDVTQSVPQGKPLEGCVRVALLPEADYQQRMLENITAQVAEWLDLGVAPTDMAILVRTNSQIPLIANYFMEQMPQVRIVSDEAFRLDASPAVLVIIQALRSLTHPDDAIARAYLAKMCSSSPLHEGTLDEKLPEAFAAHADELLRLPLYELTERLFAIFSLNAMQGQSAYLCAFYDQVAAYVSEQSANVFDFLREWDESLCSKTIQSPEVNGIRLISIHKSKGLEFPYVIIPFCDWRLELGDILWCQPQEAPFNELPIVPIDYSQKGMAGTIYQRDYDEEHQQNMVDNLNLLYVAFTRASRALTVIGKRGSKQGYRSALIEQTLPEIADKLPEATISGEEDAEAPLLFGYGSSEAVPQKAKAAAKNENVFLQESQPVQIGIEVSENKVEFKQSNKSRTFATPQDDADQQERSHYIQLGSILHEVFSTIRTTGDIDTALRRMELDGIIYDQHLTRERIETMIRKRIESPKVASWFDAHWTLFNECTILCRDDQTGQVYERRPDRVMTDGQQTIVVDFKFGHPRDEYHDQVREYMQLLAQMGHPNVSGYLWFVYSNQIIEVK